MGSVSRDRADQAVQYLEIAADPSAVTLKVDPLTPRDQLILEHLHIVHFTARRIHERLPAHVLVDDLYSAGAMGLLDAATKFDPSRNIQFATYAQIRIRGAILDSLRLLDWCPRELRRKARAIENAIQILTARNCRAPSGLEIAQELNIDTASYQRCVAELREVEIDTFESTNPENGIDEGVECSKSYPQEDPLFHYLNDEIRRRVTEGIGRLPDRERLVVTMYYFEEMRMKDIGIVLGLQPARISQIHSSAVIHLRAWLTTIVDRTPAIPAPAKARRSRSRLRSRSGNRA